MDSFTVIQSIIDAAKAHTYLEIGVNEGNLFFNIKVPRKIGVDPVFRFGRKKNLLRVLKLLPGETYRMTSNDFFENYAAHKLGDGIDVAFVDGMHTYKQALTDTQNCLRYLNKNGVIIMHDCNPPAASFATPVKESVDEVLESANRREIPGWTGFWNGDVWKAVIHLRALYKEYNIFTLDLHWGLAIIHRSGSSLPLDIDITSIGAMDYSDLAKDREILLNLKPPKYLSTFLKDL